MLQLPRTHSEQVKDARSQVTTENIYNFDTVMDSSKRFKLSLHQSNTMADLRADFITLKAGNSYEILVNPTVLQVEISFCYVLYTELNCLPFFLFCRRPKI